MNPHWIDILDEAYGDHVAFAVADDFQLQLFPADDRFFYQNLMNQRSLQTACADGLQFFAVIDETAAGAALDAAATEERILTSEVKAQVPYPDADAAMRLARGVGAEMLPPDYTDVATILRFRIGQSEEPALIAALQKIHTLTVLSEE